MRSLFVPCAAGWNSVAMMLVNWTGKPNLLTAATLSGEPPEKSRLSIGSISPWGVFTLLPIPKSVHPTSKPRIERETVARWVAVKVGSPAAKGVMRWTVLEPHTVTENPWAEPFATGRILGPGQQGDTVSNIEIVQGQLNQCDFFPVRAAGQDHQAVQHHHRLISTR